MADKDRRGMQTEGFCPMSASDIADMDEVRDIEDPEPESGDWTNYIVCGEYVLEANTAERLKRTFRATIEAPYVANKARWAIFFERARARSLQLGVGRRIISPQHAYTEEDKRDAEYFCEYGLMGCKIDA
jgi:hypothetical protein